MKLIFQLLCVSTCMSAVYHRHTYRQCDIEPELFSLLSSNPKCDSG